MYPSDIRPLTSLRIIAALWVLVYHFREHLGLDLDRIGLVAKGYLGVDLFFILSGFILSHVYLRSVEERRFNYGSFLWARLARIYPVHLVTLAAMAAIWFAAMQLGAEFAGELFDVRLLPQNLALVHAWGTAPTVSWNFPSWSISAEWFAYLLFPVFAASSLVLRRAWALGPALALVLFGGLFLAALAMGVELTNMTAQVGAIRIVPAFMMGVALHRLGLGVTAPAGVAWGGAAGALVWIVTATSSGASDAVTWPALALLIWSLAETSKHGGRNVLAASGLVYLGEVSYAVYMTHLPVDVVYFHALERIAPQLSGAALWAAWGGVFVAILAGSAATYHLVERPARNWLRRHDPFAPKVGVLQGPAAAAVREGA